LFSYRTAIASKSVIDGYSKLSEDVNFRKERAEKVMCYAKIPSVSSSDQTDLAAD
jgi:hypothetical protein